MDGIIVKVVLSNLDLHFQGQTFSCYAFATTRNGTDNVFPWQICLDSHGSHRGVALVDTVNRIYKIKINLDRPLLPRNLAISHDASR